MKQFELSWLNFSELHLNAKEAIACWIWEWNPAATDEEQHHEQAQHQYAIEWIAVEEAKRRCMDVPRAW